MGMGFYRQIVTEGAKVSGKVDEEYVSFESLV